MEAIAIAPEETYVAGLSKVASSLSPFALSAAWVIKKKAAAATMHPDMVISVSLVKYPV